MRRIFLALGAAGALAAAITPVAALARADNAADTIGLCIKIDNVDPATIAAHDSNTPGALVTLPDTSGFRGPMLAPEGTNPFPVDGGAACELD